MFYTTMKREHTALFVFFFISGFDMYSMNIGAAVPSMTVKILDAMDVVIPSDKLFKEFDDIAQVFFGRIAVLRRQNEELGQARDYLLSKLMSGELEVKKWIILKNLMILKNLTRLNILLRHIVS